MDRQTNRPTDNQTSRAAQGSKKLAYLQFIVVDGHPPLLNCKLYRPGFWGQNQTKYCTLCHLCCFHIYRWFLWTRAISPPMTNCCSQSYHSDQNCGIAMAMPPLTFTCDLGGLVWEQHSGGSNYVQYVVFAGLPNTQEWADFQFYNFIVPFLLQNLKIFFFLKLMYKLLKWC